MNVKSYSTRANALRALKKICIKCVPHAKELIQEVDGKFQFDEDRVEQMMTNSEWQEVWGHGGKGLPDETIKPSDEQQVAAAMAAEKEVIKLVKRPVGTPDAAKVLLGVTNVMNSVVCPKCGSEGLYTGRNDKGLVVDEDKIIGCHHCDWEVDTRKTTKTSTGTRAASATHANTMKTSLKLNREIVAVDAEGKKLGMWKNAFQMWKANLSWMTSAQQDALTAKLYAAAKNGEQIVVEINSRRFQLTTVAHAA